MKKFGVLFLSTATLFVGVIVLSFFVTAQLNDYKQKKEQIAEELGFKERLMNGWEWVPGNTIGTNKVAIWQGLEKEAEEKYNGALFYSVVLAVLMLIFIIVNISVYRKKPQKYQVFGLIMIFCSMSFLFLAVQAPFLEIMAYNNDLTFEVPIDVNFDEMDFIGGLGLGEFKYDYKQVFDGRIYYLYQNKSVIEIINLLYTGGNFLIAVLVILITLVFPVFKFAASIIVLFSPQKKSSIKIYKIIRNLGKWSMVDVFASAIVLAYFAFSNMNEGVDTGSTTLVGLYYFLLFVVLSINSGQYLKKAMKKAQVVPEGELD